MVDALSHGQAVGLLPVATDDSPDDDFQRILLVGRTGQGKTAQIWTLPGRKFAYILDPNSMNTLRGCPNLDRVMLMPDMLELDATLKGFNKGAKDDKLKKNREPTLYVRWVEDINQRVESGFFADYDWLIIDSLTFLNKAVMDRQLFINGRYGGLEDLADYRVVGSKVSDVFLSISGLPMNIFCTGHTETYQDDKTKKIETQLALPGKARRQLPLQFTNIWLAHTEDNDKGQLRYLLRTQPVPRGLQDIRNSLRGLAADEDVTIENFENADRYGIGKLLEKHNVITTKHRHQ